jgi:hypothetical protein
VVSLISIVSVILISAATAGVSSESDDPRVSLSGLDMPILAADYEVLKGSAKKKKVAGLVSVKPRCIGHRGRDDKKAAFSLYFFALGFQNGIFVSKLIGEGIWWVGSRWLKSFRVGNICSFVTRHLR